MARESGIGAKRARVKASLIEVAERIGQGGKLPTLRELKERLDAGQSTIVSAIVELEDEGVLRRRHGSGIYVEHQRRQREIALLCDPTVIGSMSPLYRSVIEILLKEMLELGSPATVEMLRPRIAGHEPPEALESLPTGFLSRVEAGQIGIVVAILVSEPVIRALQRYGCTVVSLFSPGDYIVYQANLDATAAAATELAARGCKRLEVLGSRFPEEIEVFRATATLLGVPEVRGLASGMAPHEVIWGARREDPVPAGYREALRIFGTADSAWRPDGLFLLDDVFAADLLAGLDRLGVHVGETVQVATMCHRYGSPLYAWNDRIIRIEFDPNEFGRLLTHAVQSVYAGTVPSSEGWERAVQVMGPYGVSVQVAARCTVSASSPLA